MLKFISSLRSSLARHAQSQSDIVTGSRADQEPGSAMIAQNGDIFDPAIHLNYVKPSSTISMADLGLKGTDMSTPIAGSVPFPLLSHEGVLAYRRSMMRPEILRACGTTYSSGTMILRNLAKYSKFIADFWSHPETTRIVSEVAGVPLSIIMPTEIGHTNIQTSGSTVEDMLQSLQVEPPSRQVEKTDDEEAYDPLATDSVIPWHYDSYPYVCVLMLSDTTHMTGGETYIKKGDGTAAKIEGPALGYAVVLQGGQVQHLAARAFGSAERITTITSYRANVDGIYDDSYLSNVRPYAKLNELYPEWTAYRLDKLHHEISRMQRLVAEAASRGETVPLEALDCFAEQQIAYLKRTVRQMISPSLIESTQQCFGSQAIHEAGKTWTRVRAHPRFETLLPAAMESTKTWGFATRYLVDWYETRGAIDRDDYSSIGSQHGPFMWDKTREYTFGDELLRQGLKEVLLEWLNRTTLLSLARE